MVEKILTANWPQILVGLTLAAALHSPARASTDGIFGYSGSPHTFNGANCLGCHSGNGVSPATLTLQGPREVNANETHQYTLTLTGGPARTAGVDVSVDHFDGDLRALDNSLQKLRNDLAHRVPKNFQGGQVQFKFNWKAPSYNANTEIFAAGNSSDGEITLDGDAIATTSLKVRVRNGQGDRPREPDPDVSPIALERVASGIPQAISIAHAGDSRLFVIEQRGRIHIINNGNVLPAPFLDIRTRIALDEGEQGLLGLAFHPNYARNGYFYVHYTARSGAAYSTRISRFSVSSNSQLANSASETVIMEFPRQHVFHNGGDLKFGKDGYLYFGSGYGGNKLVSQQTNNLLGKIIRIDVNVRAGDNNVADCGTSPGGLYRIPPNNAFNNGAGNGCDEIYVLGMRNPWRLTFDRLTGDLWIGDVGERIGEEINFVPFGSSGGLNFGWPCYEAATRSTQFSCTGQPLAPVHYYGQDVGASVTGGFVYRGSRFPRLNGRYFFTDYATPDNIYNLVKIDGKWVRQVALRLTNQNQLATFGEDAKGELYLASRGIGEVFRIIGNETDPGPAKLSVAGAAVTEGINDRARVSVSLSGAVSNDVSVKIRSRDGTAKANSDYRPQTQTLLFRPGERSKSVDIAIIDDQQRESNESFSVELFQPDGATISTASATVSITDDDGSRPDPQPSLSITGTSVAESENGRARLNVRLSEPASSTVTVKVRTLDGSAKVTEDYRRLNQTVTFEPGQRNQNVAVVIVNDERRENTETFQVELYQPVGATVATARSTVTVSDDDGDTDGTTPEVSVFGTTVTEGVDGVATVKVNLSQATTRQVSVDIATTDDTAVAGSDYRAVSQTIVFAAGERSKAVDIKIVNDETSEATESFKVELSNPVGTAIDFGRATVTIRNDDDARNPAAPTLSVADVTVTEANNTVASVKISLSSPAQGPVSVRLRTKNGTAKASHDYVELSRIVTLRAGDRSAGVNIAITNDDVQEATETFQLELIQPQGATIEVATATVTVKDDDRRTTQRRLRRSIIGSIDAIESTIATLRPGDFKNTKGKRAVTGRVSRIKRLMRNPNLRTSRESSKSASQLIVLLNGCGSRADKNDAVVNCRSQKKLRTQVRRLQTRLQRMAIALDRSR